MSRCSALASRIVAANRRTNAGAASHRRLRPGSLLVAIIIASVATLPAVSAQQTAGAVLYVDANAPAGGDGSSWQTALPFLQDALAAAKAGDEIRLAQGLYQPDRSTTDPAGTGNRYATFSLTDGVTLKGGYAGIGAADPDARDVALCKTVLSGDLGSNDAAVTNPAALHDDPTRAENSYTVVRCEQDVSALLDGVTVAGAAGPIGHGLVNSGSIELVDCIFTENSTDLGGGGGLFSRNALTAVRCTFVGNSARYSGGGIYVSAAATFSDCVFANNYARGGGAGAWVGGTTRFNRCLFSGNHVAIDAGGGLANASGTVTVVSCTFADNNSSANGAGMSNGNARAIVVNSVFRGNNCEQWGGGFFNDLGTADLINCTFTDNSAAEGNGALYARSGTINLVNTIVWANSGPNVFTWNDGTVTAAYSCIEGWTGGGVGNIDANPRLVDLYGPDMIAGTGDEDLRLRADSPCLDAGDNSAVPADTTDLDGDGDTTEPIPFDFAGQPRFVDTPAAPDVGNGTAPLVDMGAYEGVGGTVPSQQVFYVDDDAPAGGDGTTWSTAYRFLSDTLVAARHGGQVRVAQGTYRPDRSAANPAGTGNREATFTLVDEVTVRGGYAGIGAADPDANDPALYETTLSGDLAGNDAPVSDSAALHEDPTRTENSYHVVTGLAGSGAVLEGVTVTGGHAGGSCEFAHGGGLCNYGQLWLTNCTITGNVATGKGGGLGNFGHLTATGCTFLGNSAIAYGGGMYNNAGSTAELTNCRFAGNVARIYQSNPGAALRNDGAITLGNCVFVGNSSATNSGVYCSGTNGSAVIANCTFAGNVGGGIYANETDIITNCIVWGNTSYQNAGILGSTGGVSYCCIQDLNPTWFEGPGNIDADPLFVRAPSPGPDGQWGTSDDDYGDLRLAYASPCFDAGNNAAVVPDFADLDGDGDTAEPTPLDIAGAPRFIDSPEVPDTGSGTAPIVDIGAYEGPWRLEPRLVYVDDDAPAGGDGTSWSTAYRYLQDALASGLPNDRIFIAQGVYKPDRTAASPAGTGDREATFEMINATIVRGGYAGIGAPDPDARDVALYPTILSGDLAGDDAPLADGSGRMDAATQAENSYHVVTCGQQGDFALEGLRITGSYSYLDGAGLYGKGGDITVTDCTFAGNAGNGMAGLGTIQVTRCTFAGNGGTGLYKVSGTATLTDCSFTGNRRGMHHTRGNYLGPMPVATLTNCLFSGNRDTSFPGRGGGMYCVGSATLTDCTFTDNRTSGYGGGLYSTGTLTLTGCTFRDNQAANGGGLSCAGTADVVDCTFDGNVAEQFGGGVHNGGDDISISESADIILTNCTFAGNRAAAAEVMYSAWGGGGLYNDINSTATVAGCSFAGNTAGCGSTDFHIQATGGGVCNDGTISLTNCAFTRNTVTNSRGTGGGLFSQTTAVTVTGCSFVANAALNAGAILNGGNVANCTIVGNRTYGGGASVLNGLSPSTVTNCIIWGNVGQGLQAPSDLSTIRHNCIQDWTAGGVGNISSDPRFVDLYGPDMILGTADDDLRLRADSPCLDAGSNADVPPDTFDLDNDGDTTEPLPLDAAGEPRFVDTPEAPDTGSGTAPIVDMGAYEGAWAPPLGNPVYYVDDNAPAGGDGTTWGTAFKYLQDAVLAARNGGQIRVAGGTYRPDRSSATPDGSGDRSASFVLLGSVTLRGGYAGVTAPDPDARDVDLYETILSGDLAGNDAPARDLRQMQRDPTRSENSYHVVRIGQYVGDTPTTLDGVTIVGGFASKAADEPDGGGLYNEGAALLSRCTFRDNGATWGNGGAICNKPSSTITLANGRFDGNMAAFGGAIYSYGATTAVNCTFVRNQADRNGGAFYGLSSNDILINCTFVANKASLVGGAVYRASGTTFLTNCILWANLVGTSTAQAAQIAGGTVNVNYSCVQGWTGSLGGTGNTGADPRFVRLPDDGGDGWGDNPATPDIDEAANDIPADLRLWENSPCIDAGDNTAVPADTADLDNDGDTAEPTPLDLAGGPRFVDTATVPDTGSGTAPIVDMGAYEGAFLPGDANKDGRVDAVDLLMLAHSFASSAGDDGYDPRCDFNGDGRVNVIDLLTLANNFARAAQ